MNWLEAVVLGAVQGFTEFIPVSSSAHLLLVPWMFGFSELPPDVAKTFDVALHLGTLVALVIAVRKDVLALLRSVWAVLRKRRCDTFEERLVLYIVAASVPAGVAGVLGEKLIEEQLSQPWLMALTLAGFGLVMLFVDRAAQNRRPLESLTAGDAWFVGLAQMLALVPGTSRSGITLTGGILRGLTREAAVRFSFLISLPVIAGAVAYKAGKLLMHPEYVEQVGAGQFAIGILVSFVTGYIAIEWLLRFLRTRTLMAFVVYRFALAAVILVLIGTGVRSATLPS